MRTLTFDRLGNPAEVLKLTERPDPAPGDGEARVRLTLAPIHNHDLMSIRGRYGTKPPIPGALAGSEACGVVDAVGAGVSGIAVGQRVAVVGIPGVWGDKFIAKADRLIPLPDSIDDAAGCQLMAMPMSALLLLDDAALRDGEWLVQNAANGSVGKAVAKIAAQRGLNVLNLVRRADAVAELTALGIRHVVATDAPRWWEQARAMAAGGRLAVGVDSVGGESAGALLRLLDDGGRMISFGAMGDAAIALDPADFIFKSKTVGGFWALTYKPKSAGMDQRSIARQVFELVGSGVVKLTVDETFGLGEFAKAFEAHAKPGRSGKITFRP